MKIDYELVEKIGATHYANGYYYQVDGVLLCWSDGRWSESTSSVNFILNQLKPIPPKPPVRVEYEKVTESIFDLRDEFERGELYFQQGGEYLPYKLESEFAHGFMHNRIYRRIEKPVDWREVTSEWVQQNQSVNIDFLTNAVMYYHGHVSSEEFLEMCRVALRANGEL